MQCSPFLYIPLPSNCYQAEFVVRKMASFRETPLPASALVARNHCAMAKTAAIVWKMHAIHGSAALQRLVA